MTASSPDLSDRSELRLLAGLVVAIRRAQPCARFLLVGALARDLLLSYAHGIPSRRATEDLDFAFAVDNWRAFTDLRASLIASGGFADVADVPHRLLFDGRRVDLIPFGGVENPEGAIDWPAPRETRMVVLGVREAMGAVVETKLPGDVIVAVASLPALALLKLFAWGDRRYLQRGKDAGDLWLLLRNYLDAGNRERLYVEAAHLLEARDYDDDLAGAWLMGSDARRLLVTGSDARSMALARALELLADDAVEGPVPLAADMDTINLQHAVDMLEAFRAGLSGATDVDG
ncbi:MAG: nucleotidyl transferase AbiEii/AbiGii toxin family protein [Rhodanobacteraceae bacterium]